MARQKRTRKRSAAGRSPKPDARLVGYCGLYCGDCLMRKGEVADLARDLRKKLREVKFERFARALSGFLKPLADYEKCYAALGSMVRLRCSRACADGGGNPR
jgi:hypothetical protein